MFPFGPGSLLDVLDDTDSLSAPAGMGAGESAASAPAAEVSGPTGIFGGAYSRLFRRAPILAMRDMTEEDEELVVLL